MCFSISALERAKTTGIKKTSVIQYNRIERRENTNEIWSQQSGMQVVSKQANSSLILESTRVDSEWQMIAEWTESTWPVWFDFLKTEKIINVTVRMNQGENGL